MGVNFLRQYKFILLFLALLVFCSVMVIRQFRASDKHHIEIREAFVLLHTKGYTNEAQKLYRRLLRDLDTVSNTDLIEDFRRTMLLIDPHTYQPSNLIYNYHWTVSKELERRSESTLTRALELAQEEK